MVKVIPSSGQQKCMLDKTGMLKCYLKSPPEDGAANKELITFLARSLHIPPRSIEIITGATSRKKTIALQTTLTIPQIYTALGLEGQNALF